MDKDKCFHYQSDMNMEQTSLQRTSIDSQARKDSEAAEFKPSVWQWNGTREHCSQTHPDIPNRVQTEQRSSVPIIGLKSQTFGCTCEVYETSQPNGNKPNYVTKHTMKISAQRQFLCREQYQCHWIFLQINVTMIVGGYKQNNNRMWSNVTVPRCILVVFTSLTSNASEQGTKHIAPQR